VRSTNGQGSDAMRTPAKIATGACLLAASLMAAGGCGRGDERESGTVIVDGSSTVFRISKVAQEAFSRDHPDVTVVVDNHGTGGGFSRYLQGEVDIVDASRPAKPEEEAQAKAQGIDWTRFVVGYDGITLVVNPQNDFVKALSVAQLKAIWEPDSQVKTWKDVDPSWPARKLILYSPDRDSGTFEFFTEAIVGKARSQRDDVQQSPDDNTLVTGVAGDRDGLGYFGYAYFAAYQNKLRAVPIQDAPDRQPVAPSPATIEDKSYAPLSRPLYLYAKNSALRRPDVSAFLRYYLDNLETLARRAGYVAPTPADRAANRSRLPRPAAQPVALIPVRPRPPDPANEG
jgi:phosphate transport system substrate-binding protein